MTIRVTVEHFAGPAMHRKHVAHVKLTPLESGAADPRCLSWLVEAESEGAPLAQTIVRGFDSTAHSDLDLVRRAMDALADAPLMRAADPSVRAPSPTPTKVDR